MKTMKTIMLAVLIIMIGVFSLTAQTQIGIHTGLAFNNANISGPVGEILPASSTHTGYQLGIYADIPMNAAFAFHSEVSAVSRGFAMDQGTNFTMLGLDIPVGVRAETHMNYVQAAALLRYKIGNDQIKAFVEAGPSMAIARSAYIQPKAMLLLEFNLPRVDIDLSDDLYSRTDYAANIGGGVELAAGPGALLVNLRYTHGLSNVLNDPIISTDINHRSITMSVGYGYAF